jgi:hemolysin III
VSTAVATLASDKPRLRGVSHSYACFALLLANTALFLAVRGAQAKIAVVVYAASLAFLYGVSALYHRLHWSDAARARMRALDHSAIFVLIAGSWTPMLMLLPPPGYGGHPVLVIWALAAVGIGKSLFWSHGPKWITAFLAVVVGWSAITHVVRLAPLMTDTSLAALCTAGIIYSIGAIVYARRRPDPIPHVFGYHEVFHLLVIVAGLCHYGHVLLMLSSIGVL